MARRDAGGVRLLTRRGYDWTSRFTLIARAVADLRCRSCLIDGEAVFQISNCSFAIACTAQPSSMGLISWNWTVKISAASRLSGARMRSFGCREWTVLAF
jgi:hypothetical protein